MAGPACFAHLARTSWLGNFTSYIPSLFGGLSVWLYILPPGDVAMDEDPFEATARSRSFADTAPRATA